MENGVFKVESTKGGIRNYRLWPIGFSREETPHEE